MNARSLLVGLLGAAVCGAGCGGGKGASPPRSAAPTCQSGPFTTELGRLMPAITPIHAVELGEAGKIKKNVEPGCMVPFRDETGDARQRDVGRVDVELAARDGSVIPVGHGRLYIGRGHMTLLVKDDAGDEKLLLAVEGRRIVLRRKGQKTLKTSVSLSSSSPLELPFDALVAALEGCEADVRLGANEDVSVVEARRGPNRLWRTRWLDPDQPNAIDTGTMCSEADAVLAWRSQAGALGWSLVLVSARAPSVLRIKQQVRAETDADLKDGGPQIDFDEEKP